MYYCNFIENIEEIFDYIDQLTLEERLLFLIDKGSYLFLESKIKTIKYLKSLVAELVNDNTTKYKDEVSTDINSLQSRNLKSSYIFNTKVSYIP